MPEEDDHLAALKNITESLHSLAETAEELGRLSRTADETHVTVLRKGPDTWNQWRSQRGALGVRLNGIDLSGLDLRGFNFRQAYLIGAKLRGADLREVDLYNSTLYEADLTGAKLSRASLIEAKFQDANLTDADVSEAQLIQSELDRARLVRTNLCRANLTRALLRDTVLTEAKLCDATLYEAIVVRTQLAGADLSGCRVYGLSAWDVQVDATTIQDGLVVTPEHQPVVTVDDLELAQFTYLLLSNKKIHNVLTTFGKKGVLILGRFSPVERKEVLDAVRQRLRELDYVPMMFDFEKAEQYSFTETIRVLAGLSRFIVADITKPSSVPHELQAIVPNYMVPLIPILQDGHDPYSMFVDLQMQFSWVSKIKRYNSVQQLMAKFESAIVRPALDIYSNLRSKKAEGLQEESLDDY